MTFAVRLILCAVIIGTVWLFGEALIASVKRRRSKPLVHRPWHDPSACLLCVRKETDAMESQFRVTR